MKWYADNSELNGIKEAEIPDILLFGGLIVPPESEGKLQAQIEAIKTRYGGHSFAPVKWNLKDLKKLYHGKDRAPVYDRLLETCRDWRREVFSCLAQSDCVLLVCCIEGYSPRRRTLRERKNELTRYTFSNGLMRYGLHAKENKPLRAQVVLDWPDKGQTSVFDEEYASAYARGKSADGSVEYSCGKLSRLSFSDAVFFTKMQHSVLLQVADLVVGATREFLECCLEKKSWGQGVDCLRITRDRFRGSPDRIVGRGLVVSTGNSCLRRRTGEGIRNLLFAEPAPAP